MFALARSLYYEEPKCEPDIDYIDFLNKITNIDKWFLYRMRNIIEMHKRLQYYSVSEVNFSLLLKEAKQIGFSDAQIAKLVER
jgi:hypothetical protein